MAPGAASKRQVRPRPWTALVLAVLLLAMAFGQLASLGDFVDIVHTYDVAGDAAPALAGLLLALEIGGGLGLLVFRRSPAWVGRAAGALGLGAAVLWSALAAQAFARGLGVPNCGCFGRFLGQELRWWVLVEDLEFLLLGWWAAAGAGLPLAVPRRRAGKRRPPLVRMVRPLDGTGRFMVAPRRCPLAALSARDRRRGAR